MRSLMHLMYQCAARWELFTEQRNPIALVRVKNCTRRRQRPTILTVESFQAIITALKEPYRTMCSVS
jgi:integrase